MFACDFCKKTFCRKYNLDRHLNKKNKCNDFETINNFTQKKVKVIKKIKDLTKKNFYQDLKNNTIRNTTYYDKIAKEFITKNILFNKNTNIGINFRLNK